MTEIRLVPRSVPDKLRYCVDQIIKSVEVDYGGKWSTPLLAISVHLQDLADQMEENSD